MNPADRITRLQQVADHRTVRKTLAASGIGSVIFGVFAVVVGVLPPFDPILTAVGVVLLGTGIWNIVAPKPIGIVIDGVTLLLVGGYNLTLAIAGAGSGGDSSSTSVWAKVGIFQVIWGLQAFWRFRQFRHAFDAPPTQAEATELDTMAKALWKAKVRDTPDTIECLVSGFRTQAWKGRLADGYAILATTGGAEVRVVSKAAFEIEERGKVLIGKSQKITLQLAGKTMKGTMAPESIDRFREWKTGIVMPRPIAA